MRLITDERAVSITITPTAVQRAYSTVCHALSAAGQNKASSAQTAGRFAPVHSEKKIYSAVLEKAKAESTHNSTAGETPHSAFDNIYTASLRRNAQTRHRAVIKAPFVVPSRFFSGSAAGAV